MLLFFINFLPMQGRAVSQVDHASHVIFTAGPFVEEINRDVTKLALLCPKLDELDPEPESDALLSRADRDEMHPRRSGLDRRLIKHRTEKDGGSGIVCPGTG